MCAEAGGEGREGGRGNQGALLTNKGPEGATCSGVLGGWLLGMGDGTAAGCDDDAVCVCMCVCVRHLFHTCLPIRRRTPESPSQVGFLREELLRRAFGGRLT